MIVVPSIGSWALLRLSISSGDIKALSMRTGIVNSSVDIGIDVDVVSFLRIAAFLREVREVSDLFLFAELHHFMVGIVQENEILGLLTTSVSREKITSV